MAVPVRPVPETDPEKGPGEVSAREPGVDSRGASSAHDGGRRAPTIGAALMGLSAGTSLVMIGFAVLLGLTVVGIIVVAIRLSRRK